MEKRLKKYEREHMKMAMLKHEETFKQQVHELHRLYRIQKILMKDIENNKPKRPNQQRLHFNSDISLNQTKENPGNFIRELNGDKGLEIEDESEIQLTLGPTNYKKRFKTELSDSGTSFSSSSTGSSNIIMGANQGPNKNQENLTWGLTMVKTDSNYGYHNVKKNDYCVEDRFNQGRLNQPPWLLQALSLDLS